MGGREGGRLYSLLSSLAGIVGRRLASLNLHCMQVFFLRELIRQLAAALMGIRGALVYVIPWSDILITSLLPCRPRAKAERTSTSACLFVCLPPALCFVPAPSFKYNYGGGPAE
mmetsp:Transcript_11822/g.22683  ORF Transcript_11822/g.22683 Transcript_11822/m.22683 type:complete len:114 (-) Transcript_11822:353-694(-)